MNKKEKINLIRIIAAIVLIVLSKLTEKTVPLFSLVLFAVSYLTVGYDILLRAWKGIRKGQALNENFMMAVATLGAIVLGEYTEGAAVMIFYQVGELFQSYAVGKSRRSISELMDIRPDYANLETEDGQTIPRFLRGAAALPEHRVIGGAAVILKAHDLRETGTAH